MCEKRKKGREQEMVEMSWVGKKEGAVEGGKIRGIEAEDAPDFEYEWALLWCEISATR